MTSKKMNASSPTVSIATDDEIDLGKLFRTVWRGKWWIALTTVLAVLIGGYKAYVVSIPLYTANSFVVLETRDEQITNIEGVLSGMSGDYMSIFTEIEVLQSRELIKKLVERLDLLQDPNFNGQVRSEATPSSKASKYSVGAVKLAAKAAVKELIFGKAPPRLLPSAETIMDSVISNVLEAISVSNVSDTYVYRITVTTPDQKKSALIANSLAEVYILNQLDVKFEATEQATTWLTERVSELQVELETAESAVKTFNSGTALVSPASLEGLNRQVKDLRERLGGAASTSKIATMRLRDLESALETGNRSKMIDIAGDSSLKRTFDLVEKGTMSSDVFDKQFQREIDRAKVEETRSTAQKMALQKSMDELEKQVEQQSKDLVVLQQLLREAEASRLIYDYFLGRLKETSVQQGIQQADSRVLSRAVVPTSPSAPNKSRILALSGILGVFLGAALVLLREMRQNKFRSAEELEAYTGYTVMGQIPIIPARKRKGVLEYLVTKPASASAEAVRNLRTSVLLSNIDKPPQIILSTSSIPGEGKTTQSIALVQNFSGLGKKVLLIEGDMRRRVFDQYFDISEERGIISVISGEAKLSDVVAHHKQLGADILVGEKGSASAADIFTSDSFAKFLAQARQAYDIIIIDSPPVLVVPDARVIAQSVDAILYAVKWDSTSKSQVVEGLRSFESVNARVTGLVLNQIAPGGMKRYGYGGVHSAYANYGKNYYDG
ncbi:GumC family protein [Falsihalocynthiibacter sp. BN13B15]|uniref:GumC family protein n=1 Tax=Falsihalocynthiibacter sp. BN13B15 TaxID=3240871 RepID=UPI00350F6EC4